MFIVTFTDKIVFTINISARYSVEYIIKKDDSGIYVFEVVDLRKLIEQDCYI